MKDNTDGGSHPWTDAIEFRIECVEEFIEWVNTGKLDHIKINQKQQKKEPQHFKWWNMGIIVEDCGLEPYEFTTDWREEFKTTEYKLKLKVDGKWYTGEDHYPL